MLSIHCGSVSFLLFYLHSCRVSHRVKTFSSVCRSCPLCPTASWFALITSASLKKIKMKKLKSFLCIFKKEVICQCVCVHTGARVLCSFLFICAGAHGRAQECVRRPEAEVRCVFLCCSPLCLQRQGL